MLQYPATLVEAQQRAREIAFAFGPQECAVCARLIIQALGPDLDVEILKLRTSDESDVIGLVNQDVQVTETGIHVGVRVGNQVFDNHHAAGIDVEHWESRFVAAFGTPLIRISRDASEFFGQRFLGRRFDRFVSQSFES